MTHFTKTAPEKIRQNGETTEVVENLIYSTKEYDRFKFFKSNRKAVHYKKIAESMHVKDLTAFLPILVNEDMFIIDGQNRFHACKELRRPVFYVVAHGLEESDMILLNSGQRNWHTVDYLRYYCIHGNEHYQRILETHKQTGWPISTIYKVHKKSIEKMRPSIIFQQGKTKFTENDKLFVLKAFGIYKMISSAYAGGNLEHRMIIPVIFRILEDERINTDRFIDKFKKFPWLFSKQGDGDMYLDLFEEIYNHRSKAKLSFKYSG